MSDRPSGSYAVMAQKHDRTDPYEDFPTPPWGTRALMEHIVKPRFNISQHTCLEPAAGSGHMAWTLGEYFTDVLGVDIRDGFDFLATDIRPRSYDWVITNPPFKHAEEFIHRALVIARSGVAIFARSVFIEGQGRYQRLFSMFPPAYVCQFVERIALVKGRLDRHASTATAYSWFVWDINYTGKTEFLWIPPCRKQLEHDTDYS